MALTAILGGPVALGRAIGAGFSLGYGVAVALGSGVYELADLLGLHLTPAQHVLSATVLFGAFVFWDNASLRARLFGHADAPFLGWTSPRAVIRKDGSMLVEVDCENSGPMESVAVLREPGSIAWSSGSHKLEMPTQDWSRINSSKIDQQKHRWTVLIYEIGRQPNAAIVMGEHTITWRLIYFDSTRPKGTHHYVTQASIRANFAQVDVPAKIVEWWSDATSTAPERHGRYRDLLKRSNRAVQAALNADRAAKDAQEAARQVVR